MQAATREVKQNPSLLLRRLAFHHFFHDLLRAAYVFGKNIDRCFAAIAVGAAADSILMQSSYEKIAWLARLRLPDFGGGIFFEPSGLFARGGRAGNVFALRRSQHFRQLA